MPTLRDRMLRVFGGGNKRITPKPVSPARENRKKYLVHATYGMAILIILAWFNNRPGFTVAALIAMAIGLVYVGWGAYRRIALVFLVMFVWIVSTPMVSAFTDPGSFLFGVSHKLSFGPIFIGIAAFSLLVVFASRERRPAGVLLIAWGLAVAGAFATVFIAESYVALGALIAVLLFFSFRLRLFQAFVDVLRRRTQRGQELPDDISEAQLAVAEECSKLPRGFRWLYGTRCGGQGAHADAEKPVSPQGEGAADVLVVGATGCFGIIALEATDRKLTIGGGGVARRLSLGGKHLDRLLAPHVAAVMAAFEAIKVDGSVFVAVSGGQFPEGSHGLVGGEMKLADVLVPLTLVDVDVLADRLKFGPAMLSAREVSLLLHRARTRLL